MDILYSAVCFDVLQGIEDERTEGSTASLTRTYVSELKGGIVFSLHLLALPVEHEEQLKKFK